MPALRTFESLIQVATQARLDFLTELTNTPGIDSHGDFQVILFQTGDFLVGRKDCAVLASKPGAYFLGRCSCQFFCKVHGQKSGLAWFGGSALVSHLGTGNTYQVTNRFHDIAYPNDLAIVSLMAFTEPANHRFIGWIAGGPCMMLESLNHPFAFPA